VSEHSIGQPARARALPVRALVFLIELYRHTVSPLRLPTCRFTPTCSQYAVDALTEYGLIRGSWLTAVRLGKCGPWHRGGWDPIPERHVQHGGSSVESRECQARSAHV
jgi:putative membrane protein insertion efficiency factor